MPLINLIHEQRVIKKKSQLQKRVLGFTWLAVSFVGLTAWVVLWFGTEGLKADEREYKTKRERMEPVLAAIASSQTQYSVLEPRLTTLQDAAMATKRWGRVLDHVSRSTPEGCWLTGMRASQAEDTEPIVVEVQGLGPTQEQVSEFILRLQGCKDLDSVNLRFTQGEAIGTEHAIKFEVTANIVGTAKPKPIPKEGEEGAKGGKA